MPCSALARSHKWLIASIKFALLCFITTQCTVMPNAGGGAQSQPKREAAAQKSQIRKADAVRTSTDALGDWTSDAPGVRHRLTTANLPRPHATKSVDNPAPGIKRPADAWPQVPAGFQVAEFATGLEHPRMIRTAPNGDLFIAESRPGRIRLLRAADGAMTPEANVIFAAELDRPFGIAFYPPGPDPQYVYVANTGAVVRFAYHNGDLQARGSAEVIVPDLPRGGHWTRDIAFSTDGQKMFVSVGSHAGAFEEPKGNDERRAAILEYNPDGTGFRLYAAGLRNAAGIIVNPHTGALWASVNERDGLGDDLVPDYITQVREGGFYGWPWFYLGPNQDPRHKGKHLELRDKVIVPDVLLHSHSAPLGMVFYTASQFPEEYLGEAFAALHGSWNRSKLTGYKVIRVLMRNGTATGEYEDFMTGFVTSDGQAWGRPVAVTVAKDGALLVTDDRANTVWRIAYHHAY